MTTTDNECVTLTVEEAARMLGISRNSAFRAVQRGQLPSIRIGRRILVPRARLAALIAASTEA
jgi:excisionase family DNA binding protein